MLNDIRLMSYKMLFSSAEIYLLKTNNPPNSSLLSYIHAAIYRILCYIRKYKNFCILFPVFNNHIL